MGEEKLERWVEQKLEDGVDPDSIKNALKKQGKDPRTVDRVLDRRNNSRNASGSGISLPSFPSIDAPSVDFEAGELVPSVRSLAFLTVIVLVASVFAFVDVGDISESSRKDSEVSSTPASGVNASVIVEFESGVAKPSRTTLSAGESVGFVNRHNYTLELTGAGEPVRIKPGKAAVRSFDSTTYYTAVPVSRGSNISGSVYVE